ncbi:hypothetical protein ISF6_3705 [Piscinibacter sakaiensis]|uniref:Uncharacterized protein n=2 Tax=Piscinibacter sakaiensis TaxID=1547922 RepID=A0A0K8P6D1_PISS1|nr:hypothetical protein ISF6_3705 [Piscinibacter sakaiensis]
MGSRLLARLDADIRKGPPLVEAACLRAERAAQLARLGRFDAARDEITALQAGFARQPHAGVSAWLCLAEGCLAYFTNLSAAARDRMQRALALSTAAQLPRLQALAAAWLAHMDYVQLDPDAMGRHLREALSCAEPGHASALARASLVAGIACHFAERLDLAQPWYALAREHASGEGDDATLAALSNNMAWQRACHAVQASLFGGDAALQARHALAAAEATENLGRWIGSTALDSLVPMLRASVLSVLDRPAEALALYETHWGHARRQGLGRLGGAVLADIAGCRWRLGQRAAALEEAAAAERAIDPSMHADDEAVARARLARLYRAADREDDALRHDGRMREAWAAHRRLQAAMLAALEGLPDPLSPAAARTRGL